MASRMIVVEGGEGVGKSTQTKLLVDALTTTGRTAILVQEPGTTQLGLKVREIVCNSDTPASDEALMLLFFAARMQLVTEIIKPGLEAGKWFVLDRYCLSTWVYQGVVGTARQRLFHRLCEYVIPPDLQIVLDGDVKTCLGRAKLGRFEKLGSEYHTEVYEAYRAYYNFPWKQKSILIRTGRKGITEVQAMIWKEVTRAFPELDFHDTNPDNLSGSAR